jgi:hypothetical protein
MLLVAITLNLVVGAEEVRGQQGSTDQRLRAFLSNLYTKEIPAKYGMKYPLPNIGVMPSSHATFSSIKPGIKVCRGQSRSSKFKVDIVLIELVKNAGIAIIQWKGILFS